MQTTVVNRGVALLVAFVAGAYWMARQKPTPRPVRPIVDEEPFRPVVSDNPLLTIHEDTGREVVLLWSGGDADQEIIDAVEPIYNQMADRASKHQEQFDRKPEMSFFIRLHRKQDGIKSGCWFRANTGGPVIDAPAWDDAFKEFTQRKALSFSDAN